MSIDSNDEDDDKDDEEGPTSGAYNEGQWEALWQVSHKTNVKLKVTTMLHLDEKWKGEKKW